MSPPPTPKRLRPSSSPYPPCSPKVARPPTRKSGRKEKSLRRLVTVLITSALKRLTWTVPRRQLSNVFCASGTLSPSAKNLCRLYSTQKVSPWDAFQRRSTENRRHHAGYLWNGICGLLGDGQGKSIVLGRPHLNR